MVFGSFLGCADFIRPDGTKVKVLSTQATENISAMNQTAQTVQAVTPIGSPTNTVAGIIMAVTGLVLAYDQLRKKGEAANLSDSVQKLNQSLISAGLIRSTTVAEKTNGEK